MEGGTVTEKQLRGVCGRVFGGKAGDMNGPLARWATLLHDACFFREEMVGTLTIMLTTGEGI